MTFWRFALVTLVAFIASPGSSEPVSEIHRLKAQMHGNADRADLKRFWSRIARQGTPLIEPSHSEKGKMIVTFLWRGTGAEDRSPVAVFGAFNSVPWQRGDLLQNLPGTDVWYRSYHLDDRIAAPYLLLTEDAARHGRDIERLHAPDDDKGGSKPLQLFLDPYSRKTIENVYWGPLTRENYFAGFRSVLGTSGMARARDPGQTMAEYDLKSLALQNSRRVWIYAPEVARLAKKPALLIVFDGRSYIHAAQMPAMLDQLMTAGRIKPAIAVFVDTIDLEHRFRELCRPQESFAHFVARELLPFVTQSTGKVFGAADTVLAGASCGGLAASYVAAMFPDKFGKVIGQSSAFWLGPTRADEHGDWLMNHIMRAPPAPIRFYLSYGLYENNEDIVAPNQRFAATLQARGYSVCVAEMPGYHTFLDWHLALAPALTAQLSPSANTRRDLC